MFRLCLILILSIHYGLTENICTNTSITINCDVGKTLHIQEATFGYLDCGIIDQRFKRQIDSDNCTFIVTDIIRKNCVDQDNCQLNTSHPELMNLCPNFNRSFLLVNYNCEESKLNDLTTATSEKKINTTEFGCGLNTCRVYCAPGCQRTCFNTYISQCSEPCIPFGCRCREGYYRDPYNLDNCITYEHCPQPGNETHEVYSPNTAGCQDACGSSKKHVDMCQEICEQYGTCEAGYICKEGYKRESCFLNIFRKQYNCVKTCNSYYWCV